MAFKKYTQSEELTVLRGRKAQVLDRYLRKVGKHALSDLERSEVKELRQELDEVEEED